MAVFKLFLKNDLSDLAETWPECKGDYFQAFAKNRRSKSLFDRPKSPKTCHLWGFLDFSQKIE